MRKFLEEVACDLYNRYGDEISSLNIIFPSRRARLFFADALSCLVQHPIWQPHMTTIDALMEELSSLHTVERIRLISELYKVYSRFHNESFDKFYFWGDLLLTDFDTIDKYMVDAGMLFRNLSDIKELEADVSYLTPEQLQIISFWGCFKDGESLSKEKERFLEMWRTLGDIYTQFREHLFELKIAYGGMMHRHAAEQLVAGRSSLSSKERYIFVGFNALSECEKTLFKALAISEQAEFYWDYDAYYCNNQSQEAGMFLRDNIRMFPPKADISHENMLVGKRKVTSVAASSNALQCKYLNRIISQLQAKSPDGKLDKETAIVLTDENLLLPVLHALPASVGKVNVTMGFPLRKSLAYSFIERLIELQNNIRTKHDEVMFYHTDVSGILSHPYVADIDREVTTKLAEDIEQNRRISVPASALAKNETLSRIFTPTTDCEQLQKYLTDVISIVASQPYDGDDSHRRVEFLAVMSEEITKLGNSLKMCDIPINTTIYTSLLRRHLQTLRIPFEGEPLEGIQIMGILETRNLDFKNVIIMSMTDDNFPGEISSQSSFIPYNLRAAYSLPTPEHHEGVYAYYFYRLIQRAENLHMLYCSHADEKSTGEPSRYIRQLEYETDLKIEKINVGVDANLTEQVDLTVEKSPEIMEKLQRYVRKDNPVQLSPTAFYRYVACPLRFYFASIAGITADDELTDEVDARMFGNILHVAMENICKRIENEQAPAESLKAMIRRGVVEQEVENAIRSEYLKDDKATRDDYTGNLTLVAEIVTRYIRYGVLPYDIRNNNFAVVGIEKPVSFDFDFTAEGKPLTMHFGGKSDRIDSMDDGSLRVVDYKTGSPNLEFDSIDSLMNGEAKERKSNIIQTLLYSMMLYHTSNREITPALYYVRQMHKEEFSPNLICKGRQNVVHYSEFAAEFEQALSAKLSELYDTRIPFKPCDDEQTCTYCDFKTICKR